LRLSERVAPDLMNTLIKVIALWRRSRWWICPPGSDGSGRNSGSSGGTPNGGAGANGYGSTNKYGGGGGGGGRIYARYNGSITGSAPAPNYSGP